MKQRRKRGSKQVRIRLPSLPHGAWMAVKPSRTRNQLVALVLAAATDGLDLRRLAEMLPELILLRREVHVLVKVAKLQKAAIDHQRAEALLDRLDRMLGGKL